MKELRAAILRMRSYGDSMGEIAKSLRIPKATVQKAIQPKLEEYEEEWTYQQDTAPSHKAKETQAWLRKNVPDFITIKEWPSYSPDLNPLDYAIWGYLEAKTCEKPHESIKSLKKAIKKAWDEMPDDMVK
uniref:Tc1-like transposase DDE domain-containing protein n=1 Tax=Acrobeloides nanus TaxID=290746 RepID=A0A914CSL2_9BILA